MVEKAGSARGRLDPELPIDRLHFEFPDHPEAPGLVPVGRPITESLRRTPKRHLAMLKSAYPTPEDVPARPASWGECQERHMGLAETPCPYVSCTKHLWADVGKNGNIKFNFPGYSPEDLGETCALRVADRGGITLEEVAGIMNLTRERIRQLEDVAMAKLRELSLDDDALRELAADLLGTSPEGASRRGFEDEDPSLVDELDEDEAVLPRVAGGIAG